MQTIWHARNYVLFCLARLKLRQGGDGMFCGIRAPNHTDGKSIGRVLDFENDDA